MKVFGQELWADIAVREASLRDAHRVRSCLRAGARALGCAVLSEHHQLFEPSGITAIVIIGESHLLASTYEELGLLAVNIQTCSGQMDLVRGLAAICSSLDAKEVRSLIVMRRLDSPFRVTLQAERVPVEDGRLILAADATPPYGLSPSSAIK